VNNVYLLPLRRTNIRDLWGFLPYYILLIAGSEREYGGRGVTADSKHNSAAGTSSSPGARARLFVRAHITLAISRRSARPVDIGGHDRRDDHYNNNNSDRINERKIGSSFFAKGSP